MVNPKNSRTNMFKYQKKRPPENGEASYHMEHVAAYVKRVDDVETQDTEDGGTKQEKIRNIREVLR